MKFAIVHYNTPELTTCLCSSINKFHNDAEIIILDNSDKKPFNTVDLFNNVKVLDNTKEQLVSFNFTKFIKDRAVYNFIKKSNNLGSTKHTKSIQFLIDYINEDFILLDSDVLIKRNIYDIIDKNVICAADIIDKALPKRVAPFIIYFNHDKIVKETIKFYDPKRLIGLSGKKFNTNINYDTGASFLEDIISNKYPFKKIKYEDYVVHYGNGSWKSDRKSYTFTIKNISFQEFLLNYKHLWK